MQDWVLGFGCWGLGIAGSAQRLCLWVLVLGVVLGVGFWVFGVWDCRICTAIVRPWLRPKTENRKPKTQHKVDDSCHASSPRVRGEGDRAEHGGGDPSAQEPPPPPSAVPLPSNRWGG